jgi:hypothetical protein
MGKCWAIRVRFPADLKLFLISKPFESRLQPYSALTGQALVAGPGRKARQWSPSCVQVNTSLLVNSHGVLLKQAQRHLQLCPVGQKVSPFKVKMLEAWIRHHIAHQFRRRLFKYMAYISGGLESNDTTDTRHPIWNRLDDHRSASALQFSQRTEHLPFNI